jgi:hypothetical protein
VLLVSIFYLSMLFCSVRRGGLRGTSARAARRRRAEVHCAHHVGLEKTQKKQASKKQASLLLPSVQLAAGCARCAPAAQLGGHGGRGSRRSGDGAAASWAGRGNGSRAGAGTARRAGADAAAGHNAVGRGPAGRGGRGGHHGAGEVRASHAARRRLSVNVGLCFVSSSACTTGSAASPVPALPLTRTARTRDPTCRRAAPGSCARATSTRSWRRRW